MSPRCLIPSNSPGEIPNIVDQVRNTYLETLNSLARTNHEPCATIQVARIASRRHYHAKCAHTHNGGEKKGMVFHHHQLEKVRRSPGIYRRSSNRNI